MMNWSLPLLALAVLAIVAWESRGIVAKGEVEIYCYRVRQKERPALFWFIAVGHVFCMVAAAAVIVLWATNISGLRSN